MLKEQDKKINMQYLLLGWGGYPVHLIGWSNGSRPDYLCLKPKEGLEKTGKIT